MYGRTFPLAVSDRWYRAGRSCYHLLRLILIGFPQAISLAVRLYRFGHVANSLSLKRRAGRLSLGRIEKGLPPYAVFPGWGILFYTLVDCISALPSWVYAHGLASTTSDRESVAIIALGRMWNYLVELTRSKNISDAHMIRPGDAGGVIRSAALSDTMKSIIYIRHNDVSYRTSIWDASGLLRRLMKTCRRMIRWRQICVVPTVGISLRLGGRCLRNQRAISIRRREMFSRCWRRVGSF